jgi:glycerol uptake facilitator-like aquaporin
MKPTLPRRVVAEFTGTLLLLAAVVGSGIMGERLPAGNLALALLANTLATGAALIAIILAFGPVSGAHLNPAVTLADAWLGGMPWRETPAYLLAQIAGAFAGVAAAHMMFGFPVFAVSLHARSGPAQMFSEFIATFGLLAVIWGCAWTRRSAVPFAVGAYITAAYWFTASTSFANPAVTLARAATGTFSGIRPIDTPAFSVAQLAGAFLATFLFQWLIPRAPVSSPLRRQLACLPGLDKGPHAQQHEDQAKQAHHRLLPHGYRVREKHTAQHPDLIHDGRNGPQKAEQCHRNRDMHPDHPPLRVV